MTWRFPVPGFVDRGTGKESQKIDRNAPAKDEASGNPEHELISLESSKNADIEQED